MLQFGRIVFEGLAIVPTELVLTLENLLSCSPLLNSWFLFYYFITHWVHINFVIKIIIYIVLFPVNYYINIIIIFVVNPSHPPPMQNRVKTILPPSVSPSIELVCKLLFKLLQLICRRSAQLIIAATQSTKPSNSVLSQGRLEQEHNLRLKEYKNDF